MYDYKVMILTMLLKKKNTNLFVRTAFFGESMFHLRPYASKVALVFLVEQLRAQGVELLDCQQPTPHMLHFGAEEIPRQQFLQLVRRLCAE